MYIILMEPGQSFSAKRQVISVPNFYVMRISQGASSPSTDGIQIKVTNPSNLTGAKNIKLWMPNAKGRQKAKP